jgi:hypothetical protein
MPEIGYQFNNKWDAGIEVGIQKGDVCKIARVGDATTFTIAPYVRYTAVESKVLQLDTLAEELHNERLNEGIAIIKESYIPNLSKTYIRAEWKDDNGVWRYVPLGMTEA